MLSDIASYNALRRYDPTRTLMLRNHFAVDAGKRFKELMATIQVGVVNNDCFGFNQPMLNTVVPPGWHMFDFPKPGDQVDGFLGWLNTNVERVLLSSSRRLSFMFMDYWFQGYIETAYRRGILRARRELMNSGYRVPALTAGLPLLDAFRLPFHTDRADLLSTRFFNDLKGITDAMSAQIGRVLSEIIPHNPDPRYLAVQLVSIIGGDDLSSLREFLGRFVPARRRAQILARTETIRSHHVATVMEYSQWGVAKVTVRSEDRPEQDRCECRSLTDKEFTLDQIEGMIPLHPLCACLALPVAA